MTRITKIVASKMSKKKRIKIINDAKKASKIFDANAARTGRELR